MMSCASIGRAYRRAAGRDARSVRLRKGIWLVPPEGVKQLRSRVRTQGNEIPPYVIPLSAQAMGIVQRLILLFPPN